MKVPLHPYPLLNLWLFFPTNLVTTVSTLSGLSIILTSTCGKKNSPLQVEHTKGRIWRQVWTLFIWWFFVIIIIFIWLNHDSNYLLTDRLSVFQFCSSRMPEAIPWSVATISHLLSQKILLFLVLYIAMETGVCYLNGSSWRFEKIVNLIFISYSIILPCNICEHMYNYAVDVGQMPMKLL